MGGSYDPTRSLFISGESIIRQMFVFSPKQNHYFIMYRALVPFLCTCVFEHFV